MSLASVCPRGFDNIWVAYTTSFDFILNGETDLLSLFAFTIIYIFYRFVGWTLMDFHFIISGHFMGVTAFIRICELGQENVQPIKRPRWKVISKNDLGKVP